MAALVRIPGWATKATVNGKPAANGTLVSIPCAGGASADATATTSIKIELNPEL
jgi:hypothetical protein